MIIPKVLGPELVFEQAGYALVDLIQTTNQPVLVLLSGGSVVQCYQPFVDALLAGNIQPYAVGLTDERYGEVGHKDSNAAMLEQQYVLQEVCESRGIYYGSILSNQPIEDEVRRYNAWLVQMFAFCPTRIGMFGIGTDGHTAGILPMTREVFERIFLPDASVVGFESKDSFGSRITITPTVIAHLDKVVVAAIGETKKPAIDKLLSGEGEVCASPSLTFRDVGEVMLFTDQKTMND